MRRTAAVACVLLLVAACASNRDAQEPEGTVGPYPITGVVVARPEPGVLTLAHDAIAHYMPAMVMDVPARDLPALRVGDRVRATLVVDDDGSRLIDVTVTGDTREAPRPPGSGVPAAPGTVVPDVPLRNQFDEPIRPADFRGRVLLLTFIYTR